LIESKAPWAWSHYILAALWFIFLSLTFIGFTLFIHWLLDTPTEFSVAELVIISVF
jgi:hypothetical protein